MTLCAEHGITELSTYATILIGAAVAKEGLVEEGIAQIQTGLAGLEATGSGPARPFYLGCLAAAHLEIGRFDNASSTLAQAFICADDNSDRQHEAELYRLKAELVLAQDSSNKEQAQNWLKSAVESARRQSAKSLELRATASLARLLASQGRREEARARLAEIYNWFAEGFDTVDLKEAKALLDQLSHSARSQPPESQS
jgi:predicted ATPase